MKNYKYYFLYILLVPLLISCAGRSYSIASEYRNKKISNSSLVIPTIDKINIRQSDNLFEEKELNTIEREYFRLLSENLKDNIKSNSTFTSVNYVELKTKPALETQAFDLDNGEPVHLDVPIKPVELNYSGNMCILFLEGVNLTIAKEQKDTSDPAKHYSVKSTDGSDIKLANAKFYNNYFIFELKYLIYDNTSGKPVSYGIISFKQKYDIQKNVESLIKIAIEKMANNIIKETPFER